MNLVVLVGRLTKNPEIRHTANGKAVGSFTLAVNRQFNREQVDFIPIVVWEKTAEICGKYLAKGKQVAVRGNMQIRNYDHKDGHKVYVTEVIAEHVEFMGSADGSRTEQSKEPERDTAPKGFTEVDENEYSDELPF